ncbi:MAG TPA: hypothetical protein VGP94_17135 [Tepidisphaeraceae bacterium]|nr:hypothetical protein [Tepidisphaeraceae bacterium]
MPSFCPRRLLSVPIAIESLESRQLLAGVQFNFVLNDPTGQFAAQPLLVSNLQAVSQILSQNFDGKGTIEVEVTPNRDYTGGPAMAPSGVQYVSSDGYFTTVEYNTVYEARTGIDPNGADPDIRMVLDPGYYFDNVAFLDPSGAARTTPIPADRQDFISATLRGLVRSMGMYGYQFTSSGAYGFGWGYYIYQWTDGSHLRSTYDKLRGSLSTFDGPNAAALYGGPVPTTLLGPGDLRTSGGTDFYHLGMPGTPLESDLMNGMGLKPGARYDLSPLDVAILTDVGWTKAIPAQPPALHCDLNADGTVSIADFIILASNLGKADASYSDGDVNSDGQVTISDLIDLAANFNTSLSAPAPAIAPQAAEAEAISISSPSTELLQSDQIARKNRLRPAPRSHSHRHSHHRRHHVAKRT